VAFPGDQHPVGTFCPHGFEPAFGVGVHPWALRRCLPDLDVFCGEGGAEGLSGDGVPVADQVAKRARPPVQVGQEFLAGWVAQVALGWVAMPRMCTRRVWSSMTKEAWRRWTVTVSIWKKSVARIAVAWVRRKVRQAGPVSRVGGGGIRWARRTLRMVAAATWWPNWCSSPWIPGVAPGAVFPSQAQHGGRGDQAVGSQVPGKQADQGGEHRAIGPGEPRLWVRPPEHGHFVAQDRQLRILDPAAGQQSEPADEPAEREVHQGKERDRTLSQASYATLYHPRSAPWHG
jgi:hypothetical protein